MTSPVKRAFARRLHEMGDRVENDETTAWLYEALLDLSIDVERELGEARLTPTVERE